MRIRFETLLVVVVLCSLGMEARAGGKEQSSQPQEAFHAKMSEAADHQWRSFEGSLREFCGEMKCVPTEESLDCLKEALSKAGQKLAGDASLFKKLQDEGGAYGFAMAHCQYDLAATCSALAKCSEEEATLWSDRADVAAAFFGRCVVAPDPNQLPAWFNYSGGFLDAYKRAKDDGEKQYWRDLLVSMKEAVPFCSKQTAGEELDKLVSSRGVANAIHLYLNLAEIVDLPEKDQKYLNRLVQAALGHLEQWREGDRVTWMVFLSSEALLRCHRQSPSAEIVKAVEASLDDLPGRSIKAGGSLVSGPQKMWLFEDKTFRYSNADGGEDEDLKPAWDLNGLSAVCYAGLAQEVPHKAARYQKVAEILLQGAVQKAEPAGSGFAKQLNQLARGYQAFELLE